MSAFPRCEHCGAVDAPWSRGHAGTCPDYVSPEPVQACAVCSGPARVRDVDPMTAVVTWQCTPCALTWTADVLVVEELRWTDTEYLTTENDTTTERNHR